MEKTVDNGDVFGALLTDLSKDFDFKTYSQLFVKGKAKS